MKEKQEESIVLVSHASNCRIHRTQQNKNFVAFSVNMCYNKNKDTVIAVFQAICSSFQSVIYDNALNITHRSYIHNIYLFHPGSLL